MFPIRVKTVIDEKAMLELNRLVSAKRVIAVIVIYSLLLLASLAVMIWGYLLTGRLSATLLILSVVVLIALVLMILMPAVTRRKVRRELAEHGEGECEYEFYEDHFVDNYHNKVSSGREEHAYSAIAKVAESGERFFLFKNRILAFVVDKTGMSAEDVVVLRSVLLNHVPEKKYRQV